MVLEGFNIDETEKKTLYVIFMKNFAEISMVKSYLIQGRDLTNDLIIDDLSVSRSHSIIKTEKGEFFIKDQNSKFGTLILLPNEIILLPYKQLAIQSGKYYMSFIVKKTILAYLKCFSIRKTVLDYEEFLEKNIPKAKVVDCIYKKDSINNDESNNENYSENEIKVIYKVIEESLIKIEKDSSINQNSICDNKNFDSNKISAELIKDENPKVNLQI